MAADLRPERAGHRSAVRRRRLLAAALHFELVWLLLVAVVIVFLASHLGSDSGEVTGNRTSDLLLLVIAPIFGALVGYLVPGAGLGQKAINRQEAIRMALPDTMDLLTVSVEAGLGFDAALAHVRKNVPGALSDEIGRMLQEMQLGVSRSDALRALAARSEVDDDQSVP